MTDRERAYQRAWRRERKEREWAAKAARSEFCPYKAGAHVCGWRLTITVDRAGRTHTRCEACERRKAGLCRTCPSPVDGMIRRTIYCAPCRERAHHVYTMAHKARHPERVREQARENKRRWRLKPGNREIDAARSRAYRKAHTIACTVRNREWRMKNPERFKQHMKRWQRNAKRKRKLAQAAA